MEYLAGDTFDPTGLVLTADVGGVPINVTTGYTITPEVLTADTTYVTISYTADGRTASTTQAVTVKAYNPVFANNTWEKIIEAAASGRASELWAVGDTKPYTIGDETYTARIIGFDHDALDATDAKYGDANYNGGKNKAAITLEMVELTTATYPIHSSINQAIGWKNCALRNTTMPAIKATVEAEIRNSIRTVTKKRAQSPNCAAGAYYETPEDLFILSGVEYGKGNYGDYFANFPDEGTEYDYYAAGNALTKKKLGTSDNALYWTSSAFHALQSTAFVAVWTDGTINYKPMNQSYAIAVAFCL